VLASERLDCGSHFLMWRDTKLQRRETSGVSVVSATWNERKTLPTLVRGIREALSRVRHEIIIVDDNSRDGTYTLASKLADRAIRKPLE